MFFLEMSNMITFLNRRFIHIATINRSGVTIPNKKVRSPTALLQALANTVESDSYAGAPYQFIDDPHTLPKTRNEKKEFTLSKASGKLSARWFLQTYPWLFESVESDPKIEAYSAPRHADSPPEGADPPILGKKKNYEQRRVERRMLSTSWKNLETLVSERRVDDAWNMWASLIADKSKDGSEVNDKLAIDLFGLLTFSNGRGKQVSDILPGPLEHRYYGTSFDAGAAPVRRWENDGPAEQMYQWLDSKKLLTNTEHCWYIRSLLKYGEREKAKEIYVQKVCVFMLLNALFISGLSEI